MKKSILNKPEDQIFGGFLTMFLRNMTQKRPAALLQPDDIPAWAAGGRRWRRCAGEVEPAAEEVHDVIVAPYAPAM